VKFPPRRFPPPWDYLALVDCREDIRASHIAPQEESLRLLCGLSTGTDWKGQAVPARTEGGCNGPHPTGHYIYPYITTVKRLPTC
jgi:hypothetical protein